MSATVHPLGAAASPQKRAAEARARREDEAARHPIGQLPFVSSSRAGSGRDFWNVRPTGDFSQDCYIGEAFGRAALAYIRQRPSDDPLPGWLLGIVAREIARKGDDSGIVTGFFGIIGAAVAGKA